MMLLEQTLEQISKSLLKWFKDNKTKLNPDKSHLILNGKENTRIMLKTLSLKASRMKSY